MKILITLLTLVVPFLVLADSEVPKKEKFKRQNTAAVCDIPATVDKTNAIMTLAKQVMVADDVSYTTPAYSLHLYRPATNDNNVYKAIALCSGAFTSRTDALNAYTILTNGSKTVKEILPIGSRLYLHTCIHDTNNVGQGCSKEELVLP